MKIKKNNQHLDNIFCDLGISRGRFFDCYFGSQKLDLYSKKYGSPSENNLDFTASTQVAGKDNAKSFSQCQSKLTLHEQTV